MGRVIQRRDRARRTSRVVARAALAILGALAVLALPATTLAHPLGNFTINHYAALAIGRDAIDLDVVIDKAEIPAYQDRQDADTDGDGSVSDDEAAAFATVSCAGLQSQIRLTRDARPLPLGESASAVITFPPGAGGLSTLRLECRFTVPLAPALDAPTTIAFADSSFAERIGWREIIATADGTILDTHGLPATSPSRALTAYPAELIAQPLDIRSATIEARPRPGASAAAGGWGSGGASVGAGSTGAAPARAPPPPAAAVPGGVAGDVPDIFRTKNVTPFVAV